MLFWLIMISKAMNITFQFVKFFMDFVLDNCDIPLQWNVKWLNDM